MKRGKKTSWLFAFLILPVCLPQIVESLLQIVLADRNSNIITLQCQQNATNPPDLHAMYLLNGSALENFTKLQHGENNEVTFEIKRCIEGYFSCQSNSIMSNPIALIARPDSKLLPTPSPKYAIVGERVKLKCVIPPGRLLQQYSVTWYKSGTTIHQTEHYSVDPSDLSLIIYNVKLEDSNEEYNCLYTVMDPLVEQSYNYDALRSYDIELRVLAPPYIKQNTLKNSVIVEGENASFTCSAKGYPPPMITWYLNGVRLLPQDLGILVYESSSQSGLYNVTTSELMILAAQQKHNGKVLCLARSTGAATDLGHDNQTSQLVVFGFFVFRVDVTQKGDVLFEITLPTPLSEPVKLIMEYIDLSNLFRRMNVTTNAAYITNGSFLHLEPSSRVPFERFRVSVWLKVSSIIGPAVQDIHDHAKNKPTLVDPNNILKLERTKLIISGAVPGGLLLVIVLVVFPLCFICCLCCKVLRKKLILHQSSKVLSSYLELIKQESLSEENRRNLIDGFRELTTKIVHYRNQRQQHTTPDTSYAAATPNGIELSSRITHDGTHGPPPPPHLSSQPSHTSATSNNNGSHDSQLQGSTMSPVDEALNAFVRNLQSLKE